MTVANATLLGVFVLLAEVSRRGGHVRKNNKRPIRRRPWRKNVLWLFAFGYAAVLVVFCALAASSSLKADDAARLVQGPLMALVGGSIAIAKDLIQIDREDPHDDDDAGDGTTPPTPTQTEPETR